MTAHAIKCRICGDAELSSNEEFYAGSCKGESDQGSRNESCFWEDNQYCLKLKITLSPVLKRRTELYEKTLLESDVLKHTFPKEQAEEMQNFLAARELYSLIFN